MRVRNAECRRNTEIRRRGPEYGGRPVPSAAERSAKCGVALLVAALWLTLGCQGRSTAPTTEVAWRELPQRFTNSLGMELVLIPPGEFLMGSSPSDPAAQESVPQHPVRITKPFYLGVHEVTQAQYKKLFGFNPSHFSPLGSHQEFVGGLDTEKLPVDHVNWSEAHSYCQYLSRLPDEEAAGRRYRLPTEAEWEYACRAGTTSRFSFGDSASLANANINGWTDSESGQAPLGRTAAIGSYSPNPFGLHDMHGNVWEWCAGSRRQYTKQPQIDPHGPITIYSVLRGGAWDFPQALCRSDYRTEAFNGYVFAGFRVVCEVEDD